MIFCNKKVLNKKYFKNMFASLGVILWVGALSPEIFIKPGIGCILDEDGNALTQEGAEDFMEAYFYGDADNGKDTTVRIKYKFALLEWLE